MILATTLAVSAEIIAVLALRTLPSARQNRDKPIWLGSVVNPETARMPEGLRIIEAKFMKNHSVGMEAAEKIHEMLHDPSTKERLKTPGEGQKASWWEVKKNLETAQWNLSHEAVESIREEIDGLLGEWRSPNSLGLDVGVLGFGWRSEYGTHRWEYYARHQQLANELWSMHNQNGTPPLGPGEIKKRLKPPKLVDARPKCEKARDVAGLLAECLYWKAAKHHIKEHCGGFSVDDRGRLLGFVSEGLDKHGLPPDASRQAALKKILLSLRKSPQEMRTNVEWAAGVLSLQLRLQQRLTNSMPMLDSVEEARQRFQKLFAHGREPIILPKALNDIGEDQLSAILDRTDRKDYLHVLPLILAASEAKRKRAPRGALHFLANLSLQYYQKEGDMWRAWRWLHTEVRHMIGGQAENLWASGRQTIRPQAEDNWTHARDDRLRADSLQQIRLLLQRWEKNGIVPWSELEAELDRWLRDQTPS